MAADYSKAGHPDEERLHRARQLHCPHTRKEESTITDKVWCLDCGADLSLLREPRPIDTNELGPVKLDYATAVGDAKTLNWRRIPFRDGPLPVPVDKAFYVAWQELPWGSRDRRWRVERVEPGKPCPALAQWWADDLLGLPPCND